MYLLNKQRQLKLHIYFLTSFLIFVLFFCKHNFESVGSKCDSTKKVDSLIQDILFKPYLYSSGPDERRIDFIIENDNIPVEKSFKNEFSEDIKVVSENKIDSLDARIIKFDSINFAYDSLQVNVKVNYYSPPNKYKKRRLRNTLKLIYNLDTLNCKWQLIDSTILVH